METHDYLLILLGILLTARIFAELATRLNIPSVIGELLAGVVLGPSLLGWIEPQETILLLAEIGIILLLFKVGLETDVHRLINAGGKSVVIALAGFVMPFLLGMGLSHYLFDLPMLVSLFIGGTLTATSIGITVRVLSDLHHHQSQAGQIVLGAAVLDDVLGVILLAVLYEFSSSGGISLFNIGKVFLFVGAFFVLAPIAAKMISLVIKYFDEHSENPGLIPTMIVSLLLFFAWLAHWAGAPELLGGFAAGLALSRRFFMPLGLAIHQTEDFAERIEKQLDPIAQLFTPIFFVMVGLSLNLRDIDWSNPFIWQFSLSMLLIAVLGKMVGTLFIRENAIKRMFIGTAMVPRGEVGLIFAELGRVSGILHNEIYAALVIVIAITTLLPPFVIKWLYSRYPEQLT